MFSVALLLIFGVPVARADTIEGVNIAPDEVLDPSLFPIPDSLRPNVGFWHKVFASYSTEQEIFHDEVELDVIYTVLDFSDLRRQGLSEGKIAIERRRRVEREEQAIANTLRALANGQEIPSDMEHVRRLWEQRPGGQEKYAAAARHVRSQRGLKDHFARAIEVSGMFMPGIERALEAEAVPKQIRCMPFVESMFNYKARSKVGASGAWQFTRSTGRLYMKIDSAIDERSDVIIAAGAAARLLRSNHKRLGQWPLALTAYNHGAAGISRAVKQTGSSDIGVIAATYRSKSFGFASRNFYAEFVAAVLVYEERERLFPSVEPLPELRFDEFNAPRYVSLPKLAELAGLEKEALRELNPALARAVHSGSLLVPQGYALRVPVGHLTTVSAAWDRLDEEEKKLRQSSTGYRVRSGDTLGLIAQRHGVSMLALQQANNLPRADRIYVGQSLVIPRGVSTTVAASSPAVNEPTSQSESAPGEHVVRPGESVALIARRYGMAESEIIRANGLSDPDHLSVGQRLVIAGGSVAPESGSGEHVVRQGDTLFKIAIAYGTSVDRIKSLNSLRSSVIRVGQVLLVPAN